MPMMSDVSDDNVIVSIPVGEHAAGPLTAHELRVAVLVIRGLTNEQISATFGVTSRAIEFHLTNIYRKLAINRRSQLATALLHRGIVDIAKT